MKKKQFVCKECGSPFRCPTCGRPYRNAKEAARCAVGRLTASTRKETKCGKCKNNFAMAVGAAIAKLKKD